MKIIFTGVGEAFDENLPNTSIVVLSGDRDNQQQVLLDCGFTAAHAFWRLSPAPQALNTIWISHFHGDHFFGLPLLLLRFWEEKRTRPLTIIGQPGIREKVIAAMELAYPGFYATFRFEVIFIEAGPNRQINQSGLVWSFAAGRHSQRCLGVRIDGKSGSLYYSGDGQPSDETTALARGCDLVIHEAYGMEPILPTHGSVNGSISFGRQTGTKHLALVHLNCQVRKENAVLVRRQLAALEDTHAFLPEPGDTLNIAEPFESSTR
ncbi:MAG: ribonuclease Z [Deltaproteobacteria bacterium]|nr:MAG: ribonuclease Z [Deltaproteobacteria bacterium]